MKALAIALIGMLPALCFQQSDADKAAFEVAAIHAADVTRITAGATSSSRTFTDRCELRGYTLKALVKMAYGLQDYQLTGGPKWFDSDRYDIDAKLPAGGSARQVPQMMQALLADRFQLAIHREIRTVSAYALVVDKNGPKLTPAAGVPMGGFGWGPRMIGSKSATMAEFAERLADAVQHPVIDQTGLTGNYAVQLNFAPVDPATPDPGPSIFSALQDQLGLKLEPTKAPLDVTVVDRAEKPSAN